MALRQKIGTGLCVVKGMISISRSLYVTSEFSEEEKTQKEDEQAKRVYPFAAASITASAAVPEDTPGIFSITTDTPSYSSSRKSGNTNGLP